MSSEIRIVDSDTKCRGAYAAILKKKGHAVSFSSSNEQAYLQIRNRKPDLLILDQSSPGMPTEELCRVVKNDPALRDIVVFIISSRNDFETKLEHFAAGADDYLVKPIDPRELAARVVHFLHLVKEWSDRWKRTSSDTLKPGGIHTVPLAEKLPPESPRQEAAPVSQYGPYRVDSLAGQGGMGRVFRGWDVVLERPVAIKVLSAELSRSARDIQRFQREAKLLASISHPGIARIYRFGEQNGECYFVMEWCAGGSLADLIHSKKKLLPVVALEIISQCAHALSAALSKGVVHRDIKPRNIMMVEDQQVRIVDFGLAKGAGQKKSTELTQGGEIFGSPRYMAPEQALSPDVDHRADIYSLGIVFYEMIYGKPPFQSSNAIELVLKHAKEPFPPHDSLGEKIPPEYYAVIQKMTQKSPTSRYQDYSHLNSDLDALKQELFRNLHLEIPVAARRKDTPSIKGKSLFEVLTAVLKQGASGLITVSSHSNRETFLVRNNEIVFLQPKQQAEDLWSFLKARGLIEPKNFPSGSQDFLSALNACLSEEVFTLKQFQESYREFMKDRILFLFGLSDQEASFTEAEIHHDAFGSLSLGDLLLEATRSRVDVKTIDLRSLETVFFRPIRDFQKVYYSLTFTPEESFMASRFEGQSLNVDGLCQLTGISDERAARFVYALVKMGYLES